ncbi:MAG: hypothetical protein ACYTF1_02020 [Planctomycetota bacterium]
MFRSTKRSSNPYKKNTRRRVHPPTGYFVSGCRLRSHVSCTSAAATSYNYQVPRITSFRMGNFPIQPFNLCSGPTGPHPIPRPSPGDPHGSIHSARSKAPATPAETRP